MSQQAIDLTLTGRVQGVGFRPFVYRLAHEYQIDGWVRNVVGRVEIHAQGTAERLTQFCAALVTDSPPLSQPFIKCNRPGKTESARGFSIVPSDDPSDDKRAAEIFSPPDQFLCPACEAELVDGTDRRFHYPFINCTQCGPRYTIITAMPYDRENTSMVKFPLCTSCHEEYTAPENRRFHAEPNACADCGPHLSYFDSGAAFEGNRAEGNRAEGDSAVALDMANEALRDGKIIAVKGVGGYHLVCDAANEMAVTQLRKNKHRPHKPLALMVPARGDDNLDAVRELVDLENRQVEIDLRSQSRPIMLLKKKPGAPVCNEVAPGLHELGVMLPMSPLHVLLTDKFAKALVATSGNISGEPVLTDDAEARRRLGKIVDGWLTHNRRIVRPADDSVKRQVAGRPRVIRLGRGLAPLESQLPIKLSHPVIAVGGHLKNTVALAWQDRIVVSPHIGDLSSRRSTEVFQQVIDDLQRLYQVNAESVICDAHPRYTSSRWAARQDLPVFRVQHHRAHASSLASDSYVFDQQHPEQVNQPALMFTWDGVGYGDDGRLWGGEVFLGYPSNWQRVASFRNFRLTGGDRVAHEPWRSAAALHWELGENFAGGEKERLLHAAWQKRINSFESSAVGRLFDASAAITGLVHTTSHEGEAPMRLEAIAEDVDSQDYLPFHDDGSMLRIDWAPLFHAMKDDRRSIEFRAGYLHVLLANTAINITLYFKEKVDFDYVGLSGGVFQNRRLTELITGQLQVLGISYRLPTNIPANDGGISYGQVIEFAASHARNI
jgi:hydrogenase maturation protein HypF